MAASGEGAGDSTPHAFPMAEVLAQLESQNDFMVQMSGRLEEFRGRLEVGDADPLRLQQHVVRGERLVFVDESPQLLRTCFAKWMQNTDFMPALVDSSDEEEFVPEPESSDSDSNDEAEVALREWQVRGVSHCHCTLAISPVPAHAGTDSDPWCEREPLP